jgi:AraC-like DNA-binding protein
MNPEQFTIHARIHRAQRLLRETDLTVKAVGEALGYSDIYFFSRQFKQVAGRSPTEYRQQSLAKPGSRHGKGHVDPIENGLQGCRPRVFTRE